MYYGAFLNLCNFSQRTMGLELVPRPQYAPTNLANPDGQIATDWNSRGHHSVQADANAGVGQSTELENPGRFWPNASR